MRITIKTVALTLALGAFAACDEDEPKPNPNPQSKCTSNDNCSGAKPICNVATGVCEDGGACQFGTDCTNPDAPICNLATGSCVADCKSNDDCSGTLPVCNIITGYCQADTLCGGANACAEPTPVCNEIGMCVGTECDGVDCITEFAANSHCEVYDAESYCPCNDGFAIDPIAGDTCVPTTGCVDDNVGHDVATATPISFPYDGIHHMCSGLMDVFQIDLTAGQAFWILLDNFSPTTTDLDLYLADGPNPDDVVAYSENYQSEGITNESLVYTATATQSYYVVVMPYGAANQDYHLQIEADVETACPGGVSDCPPVRPVCNEIAMCTSAVCEGVVCADEFAANSHCEEGNHPYYGPIPICPCNDGYAINPITENECLSTAGCTDDAIGNDYAGAQAVTVPFDGTAHICSGSSDFYKFDLAVDDEIWIVVDNFDISTTDLDIVLFGAPNNDGYITHSAEYQSDGITREVITHTATVAGTYYLEVYPYGHANAAYDVAIGFMVDELACSTDDNCNAFWPHCNEVDLCVGPECADLDCTVEMANSHCTVAEDYYGAAAPMCVCNEDYAIDAITGDTCYDTTSCVDDDASHDVTTATPLTLDYDATRHACSLFDNADFFSFDLAAGDILWVDVDGFDSRTHDLAAYLLNNPELLQTNVVAASDNMQNANQDIYESFVYPVATAGTYYLGVGSWYYADTAYDLSVRTHCLSSEECPGPFMSCNDQSVCIDAGCAADNIADTAAAATEAVSVPYEGHHTVCAQDNDYFKITLAQGDIVFVDVLFKDDWGDIDAQVVDSAGTVVDSSGSTSDDEHMSFIAATAGDYFVRVWAFSGANKYDLIIRTHCIATDECPQTPGTPAITNYCTSDGTCAAIPTCENDEPCSQMTSFGEERWICNPSVTENAFCGILPEHLCTEATEEDNDTLGNAYSLEFDGSLIGQACFNDTEWYALVLDGTSTFTASLIFPEGDLDLIILGTPPSVYIAGAEEDAQSGGTEVATVEYLEAGTYYLYVDTSYLDTGDNFDYTLTLSALTSAACAFNEDCADSGDRSLCSTTSGACVVPEM